MLTPDELRQIKRLDLQLKRRVDSPFAGEYRSAFRGQGMEFEEVRPYVPGDDIRHIDWNVTARSNAPFIKVFREERELSLLLLLDVSGSVRFGSGGADGRTDKRMVAARLAGALAYAAVGNGDRVGLLSFTDEVEQLLPPRKTRGHAWAVVRAAFAGLPQRRGTALHKALERAGQVLRRKGVVCIIGDFVDDGGDWERQLRVLSKRHHVSAFLVHDPLEARLPSVGLVELEDAETGRRRLVDAARLRPVATVDARLKRIRRAGAHAVAVGTDEDPFARLMQHFRRLERLR